jgi:hypothetical protein
MKRAFLLTMIAVAGLVGCGDDSSKSPTTAPSASATATTMPATAVEPDLGAKATSGLTELPTTGPAR